MEPVPSSSPPGYDVFISHSSQDKPVADAVCAKLEAQGIRCWIAPRDIQPGREWAASIIEAIDNVRIMVLLLTEKANNSQQVYREVDSAVKKGRVIIPIRLQDITLSKSLEYYLGAPHWLDAMTPPLEAHIDRLVKTVRAILDQQQQLARGGAAGPHGSGAAAPPEPAPMAYHAAPPVGPAPTGVAAASARSIPWGALAFVLFFLITAGLMARLYWTRGEVPTGGQPTVAAPAAPAPVVPEGPLVFRVSTVEDLLKAIGPERIVELEPGQYNLSGVEPMKHPYVRWNVALEIGGRSQSEVIVEAAPGLTLRCREGGVAHIFVSDRYPNVLTFNACDRLTLTRLKLGHFPDPGYCTGGVVRLGGGRGIRIEGCELYGCGTEGLTLEGVKNLRFVDSSIKDCSYGILSALDCEDLEFERSVFSGNREFYGFEFGKSRRIQFTECVVSGNEIGDSLFRTDFEATDPHGLAIAFVGGRIENNTAPALPNDTSVLVLKDTSVTNNRWQQPAE